MKVYVVTGGYDYEGECVLAVFSSEEKADAYAVNVESYDYVHVNEWTVDGQG